LPSITKPATLRSITRPLEFAPAKFRAMAATEHDEKSHKDLLLLAEQYDKLIAELLEHLVKGFSRLN
jgi:hypothetical protein